MSARPHLFLSGPMGSGKSTVGRLVAEKLGLPFVDLDHAIEAREGASTGAIFRERGEAAFRAIEREVARTTAGADAAVVCALGGGTVVDEETRRFLASRGLVVTLRASADELARRIGSDRARPLLDGETERSTALARIVERRAAAYAEAHAVIDTEGRSPSDVAEQVITVRTADPILVPMGASSYRAQVAPDLGSLRGLVADQRPSKVVLVTDENAAPHAARAKSELSGMEHVEVVLASGEANKTIASVERIWDAALGASIDRDALVLAIGGGVVGDVAGFAAATLLRGVAVAHVPTTLLAMVDSAIGGKTGVDRAQGKNLVGAFHPPRFVLADLSALATLPERELRAGLAEVVKSAWLAGEAEVAALEREAALLIARDPAALGRAIRMSLGLKASIVTEDPFERGIRAHLNLGHTVGHAIETASGYALRHGEAVSLGLVAAMRVGAALGDATGADVERMSALLCAMGLPVDVDAHLGPEMSVHLQADKKRARNALRFVVPGKPGKVRVHAMHAAALIDNLARGAR